MDRDQIWGQLRPGWVHFLEAIAPKDAILAIYSWTEKHIDEHPDRALALAVTHRALRLYEVGPNKVGRDQCTYRDVTETVVSLRDVTRISTLSEVGNRTRDDFYLRGYSIEIEWDRDVAPFGTSVTIPREFDDVNGQDRDALMDEFRKILWEVWPMPSV